MNANYIPFSANWTFLRTHLKATMGELEMQKTRFAPVELPHDWLIYDAEDLYMNGTGWYRKEFILLTGEIDDLGVDLAEIHKTQTKTEAEQITARIVRGEKVVLRFEGVYMDSTVYVNGRKVCDWKYGYSTFDCDITDSLRAGKNQITVQVRHQSPNSRWYSGAGIYRKVWLKICPAVYIPLDGTYVTSEKCEGGFKLHAETEIAGKMDSSIGCYYKLFYKDELVKDFGWVAADETRFTKLDTLVENPKLWDVEDPQCYKLQVDLCRKGREVIIDSNEVTIGFKTVTFDAEKGLFLNGRHLKIHGVCEHHDLGCLGAAFHEPAMRRKFEKLQKMGVNAVRTSHNMPAPGLMELADEMGMLILSEAFDMWERSKTEYDYARFFKDWCEKDVASWVRRDRNHPSLLMWSIGNEIYDTHADAHGVEITKRLRDAVRFHDPLCNAPISIGSNYMAWEGAQNCADVLKTAGYNYGEALYEKHHAAHPDWIMYGSETASLVQSRGIYHFPYSQSVLSDEDEQCSSLGNSTTSWGARSWDKCITDDRDAEYIWGQFIWTGWDYIGEPTPYHTKNSYFGQIDTAGFPKDSYYVFQAEWTDVKKAPMVHIFPYWDFNEGQIIDVRICSNAPVVELFVDGISKGKQEIDHAHGLELVKTWQVPYAPGTITAVAYDADGKEVARESRTSFGDGKAIALSADKTVLKADGEDMCFVEISVLDEQGNPVENAANYVEASVEGCGRILGMDNGDSTDLDNYKTTIRKLFSGKLLVVVGSTYEPGEAVLTVTGEGLREATLTLTAEKAELPEHKGYLEDCSRYYAEMPERNPIRKIALTLKAEKLTKENPETVVEAALFPAETTDTNLVWRAVNSQGIDINFVEIEGYEEEGRHFAKLKAVGDGEFFVRCMAVEENRALVMSQIKCSADGLGQAYLNPYEFVSAGLFTDTIGEVGNGNDKGISTARDGESGAVYSGLNLGEYGSDEITLSVFALNDEPYDFEIWLGKPGDENSRLLETVVYQKPSIWNVYQEETYKLPERIKGVVTLSVVMKQKVHLKGFVFTKLEKAFGRLYAGEASAIYGDSYTMDGPLVREIGNNVTLVFENMDFGTVGATKLMISGKTPLPVNTIHLVFTPEDGEPVKRMVEFAGNNSEIYTVQTFRIEKLEGKGKVEFVFLPGCKFDFEGLRFSK